MIPHVRCSSALDLRNCAQISEYENAGTTGDSTTSPARPLALAGRSPTDANLQNAETVSWASGGGVGATLGSDEAALKLRPYNQRIELPAVDDVSDGEGR